jgi:hypothetical protein
MCRIGGAKVLMAGVALWSFGTLIAPPAAHLGIWALCATRVLVSSSAQRLSVLHASSQNPPPWPAQQQQQSAPAGVCLQLDTYQASAAGTVTQLTDAIFPPFALLRLLLLLLGRPG